MRTSPWTVTLARFRTKLGSRQLTHILQACIQASDEAATSMEANIDPRPMQGDDEAVAEAEQKVDVGNAPQQPGRKARKPEFAELGDRLRTADGGERTEIAIAKCRSRASLMACH